MSTTAISDADLLASVREAIYQICQGGAKYTILANGVQYEAANIKDLWAIQSQLEEKIAASSGNGGFAYIRFN